MELIRYQRRDLRVDFFRGLALWWIFTDHVPGNMLARITLHNFALCDAAEVFVLLAGYAAGITYGRALNRSGWLYAGADVMRRAWTLYVAHIFLFVVFAAQVAYSANALDRLDYLDESHLNFLGDQPYRALAEALVLRFQPAFLDILPLYVVLLLMFAAVLPLLRWPAGLAALSLAVYAGARLLGLNFPSWQGDGWFFNPLTWQLLFMIGAILSHAPPQVPRRWWPAIDVAAVAVALFGLACAYVVVWNHPELTTHLPRRLGRILFNVDKSGLHPFRLISIMALAWLATRLIPREARWLRSRPAAAFVLMGQNALPVFCTSIALSFMGRLGLEHADTWWMDAAVNAGGVAVLVAVGALAAWYRGKGRAQPPRLPLSSQADIAVGE